MRIRRAKTSSPSTTATRTRCPFARRRSASRFALDSSPTLPRLAPATRDRSSGPARLWTATSASSIIWKGRSSTRSAAPRRSARQKIVEAVVLSYLVGQSRWPKWTRTLGQTHRVQRQQLVRRPIAHVAGPGVAGIIHQRGRPRHAVIARRVRPRVVGHRRIRHAGHLAFIIVGPTAIQIQRRRAGLRNL